MKNTDKQCQALDINGKRCRRKAQYTEQVHLDNEIYSCWWVITYLCARCKKALKNGDSMEF